MQNVIEARFRALLTNSGWTNQRDFEWSLGYCQGDGVAFSGSIEDVAPLIRRVMPGDAGEAIIAGFAARDTFAGLEVRKHRYGPGIPTPTVVLDEADAFVEEDDDTAHDVLRKAQAEDHLQELERLLIDDLKRTERALLRAGYDVYEALNPGFWSKFPDRGEDVLLRRIARDSFAIEWRLSTLDLNFEADYAADLQQQLADGTRGAFVTCVALDADDDEIARSPAYGTLLTKEEWKGCDILRETMRDALSDIADEIRSYLDPQIEMQEAA